MKRDAHKVDNHPKNMVIPDSVNVVCQVRVIAKARKPVLAEGRADWSNRWRHGADEFWVQPRAVGATVGGGG